MEETSVTPSSNKLSVIKQFLQYHYLFLVIGLVFGLMLVFVNPPWHANDEDRHFYNAYALSQGYIGPQVKDGKMGCTMPTNLIEAVKLHQGVRFSGGEYITKSRLQEMTYKPLEAEKMGFCENVSAFFNFFPYVPSAIMIKIGIKINDNPIWIGWWARIGSLLAYLMIICFAVKIIPHFKALLVLIALSPMALFQGSSVTYDSMSFAFLFLLFSLVIKYYYQTSPISLKQILIFCLIAFLHRSCKDGYFILYFSLLAIPLNKFESKKLFVASLFLLLAASFLPSYLWNSYLAHLNLPPGAPMQNDFLFNSDLNLKYQLQDPLHLLF